jgi:hypothetical protein
VIDLWPDDIEHTTLKAPVTILKEQGVLLGRKTDNIVEGEVVSTAVSTYPRVTEGFEFTFYLYGPALSYRYKLLTISHSDDLYPVGVRIDKALYQELSKRELSKMIASKQIELIDDGSGFKLVADSEDIFVEILKAIFATEKVKKVIGAIIAQSGVAAEPE